MLRSLLVRRRKMPGVYVVDTLRHAQDAWAVLQWLRLRPDVYLGRSVRYSRVQYVRVQRDGRFALPSAVCPDWFDQQGNDAWAWRFASAYVEVVREELDDNSRNTLKQALAASADEIVKHAPLTLAEWGQMLERRVRRKADVPPLLAEQPEVLLDHGEVLGYALVGSYEEVSVPDLSGRLLIPRTPRSPRLYVGRYQDRFRWSWYAQGGKQTAPFTLSQIGEREFARLWDQGRDVTYGTDRVADIYPAEKVPSVGDVVLPGRVADLRSRYGVTGRGWRAAVRHVFEQRADPAYVEEQLCAPNRTYVVWLSLSCLESQAFYRPTWTGQQLDILKTGIYLDLLPVQSSHTCEKTVCRMMHSPVGTLIAALPRPRADQFLHLWLMEGIQLCS